MTEKKSFGVALLVWFFLGGIGGHRIYVQEKFHYVLWYWFFTVISFGLVPFIDAFFIKKIVREANREASEDLRG